MDTGNPAFEAAWGSSHLLADEGGYQCDPGDDGNWTGGKKDAGDLKGTKYGISAASYPSLDVANLTADDAKAIYYRDFWLKYALGRIASASVGAKLFNEAVNMGMHGAVICLQRGLRAYGRPVAEDGDLGPLTLAAINAVIPYNMLPVFRSELAAHYRLIAAADPAKQRFLADWLGRAYS